VTVILAFYKIRCEESKQKISRITKLGVAVEYLEESNAGNYVLTSFQILEYLPFIHFRCSPSPNSFLETHCKYW